MRNILLTIGLAGFLLGWWPGSLTEAWASDPIVIIANPNTGLTNVSVKGLKRLFGGKSKEISDVATKPVRSHSESTYSVFRKKILKFSKKKEKSYWLKGIIKGKVKPIKLVRTDSDVVEFVESVPQGIGIVSLPVYKDAKADGKGVVALNINGIGPDSSDYILK